MTRTLYFSADDQAASIISISPVADERWQKHGKVTGFPPNVGACTLAAAAGRLRP